jgi:oligoendopeptidase F
MIVRMDDNSNDRQLTSSKFYTIAAAQTKKVRQRSEVEEKHKWRLTDMYSSDSQRQADLEKLKEMIPQLAGFKGKLAESGTTFHDLLDLRDQVSILFSKLQTYAYLRLDEDNRESKYQAMVDQISAFGTTLAEAASYITPEIMAISDERLAELRNEDKRLRVYDHHLADMRRLRAHILPPEQERLMALSGNVMRGSSMIFRMVDDADLKFGTVVDEDGQEVTLTKQRYHDLLESKDRRVRKDAVDT